MEKYTLSEVKTKKDEKQFINVAVKLYKNYKNWIRPLDNEINDVFNPEKNELFNDGEAIRWILKDDKGNLVGRIATFYNNRVSQENEQPTGGCGFFECVNSPEASKILFDASREWLISKGMEAMDGSVNFGDRDKFWGVLVDGFTEPVYGMNYNHIYYKELFEAYGFQNYFNQYSYGRKATQNIGEAVRIKSERLAQNPDYEFRSIRMDEVDKLGHHFVKIYNSAWAGFSVPQMTEEQGEQLVKSLRPIIDPTLIYFAFYKGDPVGFFVQIPDINQVIKRLDGNLNWWGKAKFFYYLKIKKVCTRVLGLVFGVMSDFQGKGLESGMIEAFRVDTNNQKQYVDLEFVWIGDFNPLMNRMLENYVEAKVCKTHVTYRYLFDREKPFTRAPRVSRSRVVKDK